jgi:ribonucleoside-diphosphate reductase alpha chain
MENINNNIKNYKNTLPPAWVDSQSLTPEEHLSMQAVMQPYIDNAISKTINLPDDFPFEKVADLYSKAHKMGVKGCTLFRTNPITGNILKKGNEDVDPCCKV